MTIKLISHEGALRALEAGAAKARELGEPSSLAIVDSGGNLLAFLRADDAALATVAIAQNKAYTSAALRSPSADWMDISQPGAPLYGLEQTGEKPFVLFGGGLPIVNEGSVIGGVGVSGGPAEIDVAIAEVMLATLAQG